MKECRINSKCILFVSVSRSSLSSKTTKNTTTICLMVGLYSTKNDSMKDA